MEAVLRWSWGTLMLSDEVLDYIARPEGQFFDRKSARIQPREMARHLIAFANADGGTIVLGLEDDGRITGLGPYAGNINALLQAGLDFCEPPIRVEHEYLSCTTAAGEQDRLLVLTVRQSDRLHARTDDRVFLRVGDQSREMSFDERLELRYDKGDTHYEAVAVPDATLDDLDAALLEDYRLKIGIRGSGEDALIARGLARRRGQSLVINHAGILIFGILPTQWLPRADIRVLRYDSVKPETGPRMNVVKDMTGRRSTPAAAS